MKIYLIRHCNLGGGKVANAGDTVETDVDNARYLVRMRRAEFVDDASLDRSVSKKTSGVSKLIPQPASKSKGK